VELLGQYAACYPYYAMQFGPHTHSTSLLIQQETKQEWNIWGGTQHATLNPLYSMVTARITHLQTTIIARISLLPQHSLWGQAYRIPCQIQRMTMYLLPCPMHDRTRLAPNQSQVLDIDPKLERLLVHQAKEQCNVLDHC
jgi:hypothetical protein